MPAKILCVAEKPAIAKAVAGHLSGGRIQTHEIRGNKYVKNYVFNFDFGPPWGQCEVNMTSVLGHLTNNDFDPRYRDWRSCSPQSLFDASIIESVDKDKKSIAENISQQARYSRALFIWTDCDREGEFIGSEVRQAAWQGNRNIEVKRAKFSNTERSHVIQAAKQPIELDEKQVHAVSARIELDLRIGACFTRWQCLNFQNMHASLHKKTISYGSCQFPTLGFVVDRYLKVRNFVPEAFWLIKLTHDFSGQKVSFLWNRVHLFDRPTAIILYERALAAKTACITKVTQKPTSKWRPLPLTTVELQRLGSMFLGINSQQIMQIAEKLYQAGWISYPRTETDQFESNIDLRSLVQKQLPDSRWGAYAQGLLDGRFQTPRSGRNNDKAHPPIHPVNHVQPSALSHDEARVYEFITRRFLGCVSADAKGSTTMIEARFGDEEFHASGLVVLERNYLDVYIYDKWTSSQDLPHVEVGFTFKPTECLLDEGKTTPPGYLTEPDLIALMDANGIGTDATMAEHIAKIKEREYVIARPKGGSSSAANGTSSRGSTRGRGRGRGRGGANAPTHSDDSSGSTSRSGVLEFIPTTLGTALIIGYDNLALTTSLGKPFLRKEMELSLREICEGRKTKREVVDATLDEYRNVFVKAESGIHVIKDAIRKYVIGEQGQNGTGPPS